MRLRTSSGLAFLGGIALVAVLVQLSDPGPAHAQGGASCPMPIHRQLESVRAFGEIASVLTREPRCVNCHGGVNPFIENTGLDPNDKNAPASRVAHGGGEMPRERARSADGVELIEQGCRECHNAMARKRDGSESLWFTAPGFLSFVDKDAPTLCTQIKRSTATASHFLGHLQDDNGGNNFSGTAFAGNRGLNKEMFSDIPPERPSISHAALLQLGRKWVEAMGGNFVGGPECGCTPPRIRGAFTQLDSATMAASELGGGTLTDKVTGEVEFERYEGDPPEKSAFADGKSSWFRAVGGTITVEIDRVFAGLAGSACRTHGSKAFSLADLPPRLLRYMWLELAEDGRYSLSLDLPDRVWRVWNMDVESVCTFPMGRVARERIRVNEVAVTFGVQKGTLNAEDPTEGRLATPIRRGPRSIEARWSLSANPAR